MAQSSHSIKGTHYHGWLIPYQPQEWLLHGDELFVTYPRQCLDETVKNITTSISSILTNRAVCDLACDVITGDLGSIFGWVNECLANQTHGEAYSDAFTSVTLLENKDSIRWLQAIRSTEINHWRHSGPYVSPRLTFTHSAFFFVCLLRFLQHSFPKQD